MKTLRLVLLSLLAACTAFAQELALGSDTLPPSLATEVRFLTRSVAPMVREQWVVFSYRPAPAARYVAVRFQHEDYAVLHPFQLNEKKVFVLVYRPPRGLEGLTYRMSVDGIWSSDPANPHVTVDALGTEYSHVSLEGVRTPPAEDPVVDRDGSATFTYRGKPGRLVSIAGSFNHWDPYVHVLEEADPGVYRITLRLPKGDHYYYFLEGGNKRLDPDNPRVRHDTEGELVDHFQIP